MSSISQHNYYVTTIDPQQDLWKARFPRELEGCREVCILSPEQLTTDLEVQSIIKIALTEFQFLHLGFSHDEDPIQAYRHHTLDCKLLDEKGIRVIFSTFSYKGLN